MSSKYNTVRLYYARGTWSVDKVRNAVEKGWITADEFTTITGEDY